MGTLQWASMGHTAN